MGGDEQCVDAAVLKGVCSYRSFPFVAHHARSIPAIDKATVAVLAMEDGLTNAAAGVFCELRVGCSLGKTWVWMVTET